VSDQKSSGDFISFLVGGIVVLIYFLWKRREKTYSTSSSTRPSSSCSCNSGSNLVPLSRVPDNDGNSGRYIHAPFEGAVNFGR
jgi:hypothetical protein